MRVVVRPGAPGGGATIAVEDAGPGVAPEDRQHVFDRFWRAPGAPPAGRAWAWRSPSGSRSTTTARSPSIAPRPAARASRSGSPQRSPERHRQRFPNLCHEAARPIADRARPRGPRAAGRGRRHRGPGVPVPSRRAATGGRRRDTIATGSAQPASTAGAFPSIAVGTIGPEGLDGTWTIDTTIGSFTDFSSSFVGYRVNETLAENKANTAVGRTPQVSGTLVLAGSNITSVDVTADLTGLRSDDDRRDGRLQEQAIETNEFPESTFRLTSPISLASVPVDGTTFTATATGELTLHGMTKAVTLPRSRRISQVTS